MTQQSLEEIFFQRLSLLQGKGLDIRFDYKGEYAIAILNGEDYGSWTILGQLNIVSRYLDVENNSPWFKIMKLPKKLNEVSCKK